MDEGLSLIKGTLDLLVLKALRCGANHGYGVSRWLEQWSSGELVVVDSALYQALHRLEARGFVEAEWGVTENRRRARFYSVTASGTRSLDAQSARFARYASVVNNILAVDPAEAGEGSV